MAKKCDHSFLKNHPGTEQSQRWKEFLRPESFRLNAFSTEDWMEFAYTFAREVHYFSVQNPETPSGTWEEFFLKKESIAETLGNLGAEAKLTPHLTLFVTFLKLLELTQKRFNNLTQRHLDFYYGKILQIEKKEAVADQVHLLFELAKNAEEVLIEESTKVEAGKDAEGKKLQYALDKDQVFNKAKIASLKSIYHHRKINSLVSEETHGIYAAYMANSKEGIEEPLEKGDTFLPFGFPKHHQPELPLPNPTLGFAVAAPTLSLQEGERLIKVHFQFQDKLEAFPFKEALSSIEVFATGEKAWLGPFRISEFIESGFQSSLGEFHMTLCLHLEKSEASITPYNPKVHQENYATSQPLLAFKIKTDFPENKAGYECYTSLLKKALQKITVHVAVKEATSLQLKNDQGDLVPKKPFYPFGTQPMQRSSFYVNYQELFAKNWKTLSLDAVWINTPNDFESHYAGYRKDGNNLNLSPKLYFKTVYHDYNAVTKEYAKPSDFSQVKFGSNNVYVTGDNYFTAKVTLNDNEVSKVVDSSFELFSEKNDGVYSCTLSATNNNHYTTGKNGPLKMALNQSFLHSLYPKVYALALSSEDDIILPNEPYTPMMETLKLSYTAVQEWNVISHQATAGVENIQLFHLHPFGTSENDKTLVPTYCQGGELYIGLEQVEALQQVSLLFQFLEGTENPLAKGYTFPEKIAWAVLTDNQWMELDTQHILGNTTDNFLKTGLVTLQIPKEATQENTLLPSGYLWLRAKTDKSFDAFCQCLNIHAQATKATFINQSNELSHLEKGLPAGTIGKLSERKALIKKVEQPYSSFGGQAKESSAAYYKRVSERLRHKDRAITQWDYEHLILQQFNEVYKVKCLNHTQGENFHAPGHVALVVIPDIVNNNAFDMYQPRLSTAKRNEIQQYIQKLNGFFVKAEVINPDYEEVKISAGVKFKKGYDENFYTGKLEEAIKRYLSPWAFEETNALQFGHTFHRSKIIKYLEQLAYVDFLEDVVVEHRKGPASAYEEKTNIIPTSPKAILVSAKKHQVYAINSKCQTPTLKTESKCLP